MRRLSKKIRAVNFIMGWFFSIVLVMGKQCEYYGEIRIKSPITWISIFALSSVFMVLLAYIWQYMKKVSGHVEIDTDSRWDFKTAFIISLGILWLCYFIVFLGVYPGFFVYDATDQLHQTILREFNTHHPLLHTASMGLIVQGIYKITGDYNIGIAAFILFQMTAVVLMEAIVLAGFYTKKYISERVLIIFSLVFGIFPVYAMYGVGSSKDSIFGAGIMLLVYLSIQLLDKVQHKLTAIWFTIIAALIMLYRNNGKFAFFAYSIVLLIACFYREKKEITKNLKKIFMGILVAFLIYFGINFSLIAILSAEKAGSRELLATPIQQMARIYSYQPETLSEEEIIMMERYMDKSSFAHYNPLNSDLVKLGFNQEEYEKNPWGFYRIWFQTGLKNPVAYINSWMNTAFGMMTPNVIINGYAGREVRTFTYRDSSYFGYEVEYPGERHSFIPFIDRFYKWISLDATIQKIPVIRMLFSPGVMLWLLLIIIGYFIYYDDYYRALPYLLPLFVVGTCLLGPMSLVRYVWYLWLVVPFGFADICSRRIQKENGK